MIMCKTLSAADLFQKRQTLSLQGPLLQKKQTARRAAIVS